MDALTYEFLIRRAYNCGRYGAGRKADADLYRALEHAERGLKITPPVRNDPEYEYTVAASKISTAVGDAIRKVMKETHHNESKEQLQRLVSKISLQTDKEIIDQVIDEAIDIFIELKLEPGM